MSKSGRKLNYTAVLIILFTVLFLLNVLFYNKIIESGGAAFRTAYDTAKEEEEKEIYSRFYEAAFEQYKTTNDISINIENTNEEGKLEVLSVYDVAYIIQDSETSEDGTTAWLEVPGTGIFTVDIHACEFLTDHQRNIIIARIPHPELSRFTIDYENVSLLNFSTGLTNGSIEKGEELAHNQLQEGDMRIRENILSNQKIILSADSAAKKIVKQLLVSVNPVEDIEIIVEFIE